MKCVTQDMWEKIQGEGIHPKIQGEGIHLKK